MTTRRCQMDDATGRAGEECYERMGWRAVEVIPEGASGWIPHDLSADQTYPLIVKRRRLKKRRRRPQIIVDTSIETISEESVSVERRPIRPQKTDKDVERPQKTEENTGETPLVEIDKETGKNQRKKTRPLEKGRPHVENSEDQEQKSETKPQLDKEDPKRPRVPAHRPQKVHQNHDEALKPENHKSTRLPLPQNVDDRDDSQELPAIRKRKPSPQKLEQDYQPQRSKEEDGEGSSKTEESEEVPQIQRRKIKPPRLDRIEESWEDMKDEMDVRPNIRRRPPPKYQSSSEEGAVVFKMAEEVDSYGKRQGSRLPNEDKDSALADLKSLLKKSQGSISLSEILQQKNLSLTEVLNGNQKAISALTEKPVEATEPMPTKVSELQLTKHKRLPPSIALKKNFSRTEDNGDILSTKELQEAQKRRTAILQNHKENKIFSTVTKMDVVTEALTERRIFVPSHPKLYTSLNYKPDFATYFELSTEPITNEIQTTTPTSTTSSTTTGRMHLKPKIKSPIVKITIKPHKNSEGTPPFPQPIKIDISEVLGFEEHEKFKDEPLRMPIEIDRTTNRIDEPSTTVSTNDDLKEISSAEKAPHITAKDEISEILKDAKDRERLAKILESRNMTLEELVEQRERGSSQLHLADIFHNKTKEPKPVGEPHVGRIMSHFVHSFPMFSAPREFPQSGNIDSKLGSIFEQKNIVQAVPEGKPEGVILLGQIEDATKLGIHPGEVLPDTLPAFTRKQKSYGVETATEPPTSTKSIVEAPSTMKVEEFQSNVVTSAKVVETDDQPRPTDQALSFGKVDIDHVDSLSWQKVYPELFPELYGGVKGNTFITAPPVNLDETLQRLEETDDSSMLSSKERFSLNKFDDQAFTKIPTGVKSVLIVSFSIIGLSILVFLTILMVFRWLQKQRRKMNYCGSLSSKLRSPMLMQGSPTAAIKTFMNETLGRRKHYYKSNVHCMTDDTWGCDRERTPSF
ncbi:unnamed protein product [Acanthoscelides obtectus]|uniref:Uncharacterized protein n=1 Tax=Acanthoscelides obtectus TaxID=200917 RepID=A0A9P0PXH8_ACAOB|nr:unnamed protein product [Acanthoscelides obtectus]CAK1644109.1 hypothetical protein AOBTE_LOCUS13834 [Acanthoscelides obtectus]